MTNMFSFDCTHHWLLEEWNFILLYPQAYPVIMSSIQGQGSVLFA